MRKKIKIEWILNILLNFGNVIIIILMRSKNSALAEFENIEFALQTKDLLNNTIFMGN